MNVPVTVFVPVTSALAAAPTVVDVVALSEPGLGSVVAELTVAVFVNAVPADLVPTDSATTGKAALPGAKDPIVQSTVPLAPTAGVEQLHPGGALLETKVVPAGSGSMTCADAAFAGPAFVATIA